MIEKAEEEFRTCLEVAIADFGIEPLTDEQTDLLVKHYSMLCKWNERINLTRIVSPPDAAKLHYAESLFGAQFIGASRSVLDIGSGAGFPGIPLAVARPELHFTALEANQKKALFLKEVKDELGLENLEVLSTRLEAVDWAGYDLLTSRALDRAETIFPSVIERMKSDQRLMLYCAGELVEKLGRACKIKTHPIPLSNERVIAMITSE